MPKDSHGRDIDYLRISVTDHCNLRCVYCMPLTRLTFAPHDTLLTNDEIAKVVRAAASVGFRKIRITGGEPTLRGDLLEIVSSVAETDGIDDVSLTTNGILLPELAEPLRLAGLSRINIHVDTLQPENLKRLMRFGTIEQIQAGIDAAYRAGFRPVKLNAVVVRDFNEEDVVSLAALTIERDWHVRFVELMPLGGGECARVALGQYVPNPETFSRIETALGTLSPVEGADPADESRNFRLPDARGVVGFISPVSDPYCGSCNRMRLTSDGKLHLCLLRDDEVNIKKVLREGASEGAVAAVLLKAVSMKPIGHRLEDGVSTEHRQMFQIGG